MYTPEANYFAKKKRSRSLRSLMLVTIGFSIICCVAIVIFVFFSNMTNMIEQAEREHLDELSDVVTSSLNTTLNNLNSNTRTWSSWDEPYKYALGKNDTFIADNLLDGNMLTVYSVDFVIIKDISGNDLYSGSRSEPEGTPRMDIPSGLSEKVSGIAANVLANQDTGHVDGALGPYCDLGFVVIGDQPYMLCVMPILNSDETEETAGTFTFAVRYGDEQLKELTHLAETEFVVSEESEENGSRLRGYEIKEDIIISMSTVIDNRSGRDATLTFNHPRNLYTNGFSLIKTTMTLFFTAIILVMAVLFLILRRFLLGPLKSLITEVGRVDQNVEINSKKYEQYEEFHTLSGAINGMMKRLEMSYLAAEESKVSLNVLKNILNGLDAYLYVSDPVTDEILFINDKMKEHFGIRDDAVGQTCWKLLQAGFNKRCDFCPCYQLEKNPELPFVWEENNTVTNRYYRNTDRYIDWIGGKKAHLQHSVDITDFKMAQFALNKRLGQQALMASISQSFISNEDLDTLIMNALRLTGEFMGAAQILYYKLGDDGITIRCQNEWINPAQGIETHIGETVRLQGTIFSVMEDAIQKREGCLGFNDPALKEAMEPYRMNFHNYIVAPIYLKNQMVGMLDFSREDGDREWSNSDMNLATLLASLLSGVFDRQLMETQLRRLSSIVESSSQLILDITADGKVDYVNPAAQKITGYTEAELIDGGLELIFDDQTALDIKEKHIKKTLIEGTDNFEIDLMRKDGRKRIMAFSSFTTGHSSSSVGGIASDVTEVRKLESDLIASKELAEQGNQSKSEFLSRMSHEMRTPMNAIIGMTSIAKDSDDPAKKEYCLDKIDNASRHLLGVINDILDMSKIEANKFELNFSEFSFERMLLNVLNVVNFRIDEKCQDLSVYIDPAMPPTLIGDEQRLSQVITNLLTNAVKFTPDQGSIRFKASVLDDNEGALAIRVEVIDSGIGISKEQQAKLFNSFEQADGSIARRFGGTGLGLAISKRIVELMGGEIYVESELDKGSKFIFTFNSERGKGDVFTPIKKRIHKSELNIMAVDDSSEVRDYFKHVMDEKGVTCVAASGGAEALELIKGSPKPFDMVFIDWKMPGMNGVELTKELRKLPGKHPIIIMISVAEWSDIESEATEAGVNGFVPKPIFPSQLMDCIGKYLGMVTEEEPERKEEAPKQSFEGKTALLAEDVEINREIIITIFEGTDLVIDCAENGRQAVEMFAADPGKYDIIFMDVHMPEIDGLMATRQIRAMAAPEGTRVPIIAMTAGVFNEDIEKCLEAGMNDHIGKPINFDELFDKVRKYIRY